MTAGVGRELIAVEYLMLRRKRSSIAVALLFALGPLAIFFVSKGLQHASNPLANRPAGGLAGFVGAVNVLALILGPLAAILIGVQAGVADVDAGVFRDLVATGRPRRELFAVRIPAAIAALVPILVISFAVILLGTFTLADGLRTPGVGLILQSFGFVLLADLTVAVVAVGVASLTMSQPVTLTVLIGWQLIASRMLLSAKPLGAVRDVLLIAALQNRNPATVGDGRPEVAMPVLIAVAVLLAWVLAFTAAGAWRTSTRGRLTPAVVHGGAAEPRTRRASSRDRRRPSRAGSSL